MIVDNGYSYVRVFELFEQTDTSGCLLRFPRTLLIFGDSEYPANPVGYKEKANWGEVFLKSELQSKKEISVDRSILVSSLANRLFDIYRGSMRRCNKDNESFVRRVIQLSLLNGFDGRVVSITDRDLLFMGIKRIPARTALRRLHDLGILVFLSGYGLPPTEPRNAIPMGFMLRPSIDDLVEDTLAKIEGGKMAIADIKDIELGL